MEPSKNLCAQLPVSLHNRVREEQEKAGLNLSAYITEVLTQYYSNKKEEKTMEYTRTLAFQISEELFFRIKDHLARETARTGKKLSQKDFVLGLIEQALEEAEARDIAQLPDGDTPAEDSPQKPPEEAQGPQEDTPAGNSAPDDETQE